MNALLTPTRHPCETCGRETCEGTHLVSETAVELAECVNYAHVARDALPVDPHAEAIVASLLAKRSAGHVPRQLTRRLPDVDHFDLFRALRGEP